MLAQRTLLESKDTDIRLTAVFRRVAGRNPAASDLIVLRRLLKRQLEIYAADPEGAKQLLKTGASDRSTDLSETEHAAWTAVCLAVLNLDEVLVRQ